MSCVEKRHVSHRMGSMLHHRFPNGFTDLFMDETDREVSTLTDRAFRSLCVGDDAVYNDEFLYGYSPFNCHKPVVGEPVKKNHHHKESKKQQNKNDKNDTQPWKQQQQKNLSSFLKALSATEGSCEGMLIKNGGSTDSNGESWDKSALRSIQRELSEFSSDYHTGLTDRHHKNHHSADGSSKKTGKDAGLSSGKSTKIKNGKSTVKIRKLNIKNFFLHSEFSPFQSWKDFNRFPFGQKDSITSILPTDSVPKWYDLPFYKELTEAHRKETLQAEEEQSCQKAAVEPSPPTAPKPIPPPPPPKVLPKHSATLAEKRCSSDLGDGSAAPWRRNRSRAKSAIPVNQTGIQPHDNSSKILEESVFQVKKEARSVEVKAIEEVSSLASTPFSICQLMTPLIPSRQPTETSEILQGVISPSVLDLPLRPHSEAKGTPEPPVKRESYKSLASSILFNLKDNRKRVKSRYSPPKFKTLELPEGDAQSPQSQPQVGTEGDPSGFSTSALQKDELTVFSPVVESVISPSITKHETDRPLSGDYLLSNLLQTNSLGEDNPISPFIHSKKKSPGAKKQSYPSLNLYKKASPVDNDMKYLQVPLSASTAAHIDSSEVSPFRLNKELSPKPLPTDTGLSPNTLNVIKDCSPIISPHTIEKETLSTVGKRPPNVPEKTKRPVKDFGVQPTSKEKETGGQSMSTKDVIRAAREAINAARSRALSGSHSESSNKAETDVRLKEMDEKLSKESTKQESSAPENSLSKSNKNPVKREPPPIPKRTFAKSDIQHTLDKTHDVDKISNEDSTDTKLPLTPQENESVQKQSKLKHIFSSRQNNYIKHQRYTVTDDEQVEESEEGNLNVDKRDDKMSVKEMRDSEHIMSDLHALKELDKARLGDRVLENAMNKLGEEAKATNDLISRELRNIKKGMLSMRGNTSAKRDMFTKKEKEQSKQTAFTKLDSNVIINKALINDNYDKAKMALEEIISDREKRKNKSTDMDANQTPDENVGDESYTARREQCKTATKDPLTEDWEKRNGKEADLKERLGDLRDHNHLRQILSLTEPELGKTHRSGGRVALPGMDKIGHQLKTKAKHVNNNISDKTSNVSDNSDRQISRQVSEESGEYLINENEGKKLDAPPVPPRSKKGGTRGDEGVTKAQDSTEEKDENHIGLNENRTDLEKQEAGSKEAVPSHSETGSWKGWCTTADTVKCEPAEGTFWSSPDFNDNILQINKSPTSEATPQNNNAQAQETCKKKRQAPLKPDHLITPAAEEDKTNRAGEDADLSEIPRNIISPLLLVNGVSPPDQASLSSKSSYFSVESALLRNTETESNVYHSLENLVGEVEEVNEAEQLQSNSKQDSDRAEVEYYSFSDHESEPEVSKRPVKSPPQVAYKDDRNRETTSNDQTQDENSSTTSPSNTFSPTLGIPSLFKVKDNTFSNKLKKAVQPWSPRGSLSGSEKGEDELRQVKENPEPPPANETPASGGTFIQAEVFKPTEIVSAQSPPLLLSPSNCTSPKKPEFGTFLTVPQEEDRSSGISPSSGVESLTASTADEMPTNTGGLVEQEVTKAPSEHSGSTCSANDSQTGLPKPPAVLPKSEKAVLKAIKLANRRMKKEEAQKTSQSSSKHRAERHKSEKSEHKSSSSKNSKTTERKHKSEDRHNDSHRSKNSNKQSEQQLSSNEDHHSKTEMHHKTRRQSHDSVDSSHNNREASERQGRRSDRHVRDKPEPRHYSSDRVISNVPVYKAQVNERPMSDRPFQRSQSIDRYLGDKVERRLSADMSEKPDLRAQRIEKSIMDELQQRGRARDKPSRENPLRRSHSTEAPHPSPLSRQSSLTSQFSRQSSIEHAIVTQSFPITQRKLLQDPDSGQYFFVDMPVQVKTKTFFDPETGSYVQLPVQPPDGAVPQASPLEVLTPPMVVYHGFVPVPLSPMAQKATIPVPHMEPNEFEHRHLERSRQMHCKEGHPYLEPLYGQHEHMLGEFMGTEELDCPS
ncbi:uncharacterized protein LOC114437210 [Parambassis ranga]|uniref:Uncharacterized protein LOC114437210 n=1 Tax=Parambassis ranga TaxID=210632 RepID=A0A6P7ID55_9TELE|nr:uncharacterized protein LOC114437210 [Parambassis ranga]XP_028263547.1 uncharacterized protein LOC114437210 [Parambassis ranga]XP_028263548.1 uncharacterized protein LOC114437210 [Parambassis ranga]XP_028263549.1 uncharacterized protein LOC114437210 [Parambassis ranga]XP_028263550.1 uncharacterized protein LOC114437210 [Parambassis ranga]